MVEARDGSRMIFPGTFFRMKTRVEETLGYHGGIADSNNQLYLSWYKQLRTIFVFVQGPLYL